MSERPINHESVGKAARARVPARRAQWVQVRPTATTIVLVFAVFVLFKSMLPASKTPNISLPGGYYLDIKMLVLLGWVGLVVCTRLLGFFSYRPYWPSRRSFLYPIIALTVLELVSVPFNGRSAEEQFYSVLECAQLAAPVLISVYLVSGLPYLQRIRLGTGVVVILTFIVVVYMGLSFIFPELRPSSAYKDWVTTTLGFVRVFGPLGNAASLAIALFPALGFAVGMLFVPGRSKIFWGVIALIMLTAIVGTGSRGATLCLPVFGVLLLGIRLTKGLLFVVPVAMVVLIVALTAGVPERFRQFEDRARMETYRTAWSAFTSTPASIIVGVGHGRLFTPVFANTMRRVHGKERWYLLTLNTDFGKVLHGAHSTPMKVLSESGVFGAALLAIPLAYVVFSAFGLGIRKLHDPYTLQARFTLAGGITGMLMMMVNTFFFSQPWLGLIWIMLMLIGTETIVDTKRKRQSVAVTVNSSRTLRR